LESGSLRKQEDGPMPWKESTSMSQRHEFVMLANAADTNVSSLCARFGISRKTGYKWRSRFQAGNIQDLADQSRRPHHSPWRTAANIEAHVLALRDEHPAWGGRKLRARLLALGYANVPAASTITGILHRHQRITSEESVRHQSFQRFEHPEPNDLWQMDFKGDFATAAGRCHPLTVLDDHSRFALELRACANERTETVQNALTTVFRRYGLPWRMTMDNGFPWGVYLGGRCRWTRFTVWLLRLGVRVSHSRPFHPQTQGKDERFHRTLKVELLRDYAWRDLHQCQLRFEQWRDQYNCQRPHEALQMQVPAARYRMSVRPFPEHLPAVEYPSDSIVRRVQKNGLIYWRHQGYFVGEAFHGLDVALRPTTKDGSYEVFFCQQHVATLDLKQPSVRR
jgi:transposase InsO family protein